MTEKDCANGRRRYRSRQEADQLAAEFEAGGLTREEFCERNDVSRGTLARYIQRYRRGRTEAGGGPRWVAVEVGEHAGIRSGLAVVLGGGRRIEVGRGFDPATLRELVAVLEGR